VVDDAELVSAGLRDGLIALLVQPRMDFLLAALVERWCCQHAPGEAHTRHQSLHVFDRTFNSTVCHCSSTTRGRNLRLMTRDGYSRHVCVLHPKSRSKIGLRSADPPAPPVIDHHFFEHPGRCG